MCLRNLRHRLLCVPPAAPLSVVSAPATSDVMSSANVCCSAVVSLFSLDSAIGMTLEKRCDVHLNAEGKGVQRTVHTAAVARAQIERMC